MQKIRIHLTETEDGKYQFDIYDSESRIWIGCLLMDADDLIKGIARMEHKWMADLRLNEGATAQTVEVPVPQEGM